MTKALKTFFVVIEHDQGRSEEVQTFDSRAAAKNWIQVHLEDMAHAPHWYRHLADPCYSIKARQTLVEEPFYSPCMRAEYA